MEHYLQELHELRSIVADQTRDIALLRRTGGTTTWLDRCAWAAMQGLLAANSGVGVMHMAKLTEGEGGEPIAKAAYNIAAAMLAEKRRREGLV